MRWVAVPARPTIWAPIQKRLTTPIAGFHCPSRRPATLYFSGVHAHTSTPRSRMVKFAFTDYAMNGGTGEGIAWPWDGGPSSIAEGESSTYSWLDFSSNMGLLYRHGIIRASEVTDGLSNTYLVGEKYLCVDYYNTYGDGGDNENAYSGDEWDTARYGSADLDYMPTNKTEAATNPPIFSEAPMPAVAIWLSATARSIRSVTISTPMCMKPYAIAKTVCRQIHPPINKVDSQKIRQRIQAGPALFTYVLIPTGSHKVS